MKTLLFLFFLLIATASHAIVGGHQCATSEWPYVGRIMSNNLQTHWGSAVPVSRRYVLSVDHVVSVNDKFTLDSGASYVVQDVIYIGGWDLVLLDLGENTFLPGWYDLYDGTSELEDCEEAGLPMVMVGYGFNGTFNAADSWGFSVGQTSGVRYAGVNMPFSYTYAPDALFSDVDGYNSSGSFDFLGDGGYVIRSEEAQVASKDSGGPSFVFQDGAYRVAGVHSSRNDSFWFTAGGHPFGYGARSIDYRITYYAETIREILESNP